MSAVLQRLESCIVKALLQNAATDASSAMSFSILTEATDVTINNCEMHVDTDHQSFVLNVYGGMSQEEQTFPAVNVWCVNAQSEDVAPWIKRCEVNVALRYPADDSTDVDGIASAMHGVSLWLENLLMYKSVLMPLIEQSDGSLALSYMGQAVCSRSVDSGKRMHAMVWTFDVVAALN